MQVFRRFAAAAWSVAVSFALHSAAHAADDGHHPGNHAQHHAGQQGKSAPIKEERVEIKISDAERTAVLAEMRGFLESVHGIVAGLAEGKPKVAAAAARSSGMSATHAMPKSLMGKLPMEFRKLGMDTHQKFDTLALEGQGIGDTTIILKQLDAVLANCNACHAGYRFTGE